MSIRLDRIVEAYQGKLGVRLQEASYNRLDWICQQVKGHFVLDVGCSQGMCSVLLGRQGFKTTGIDIARESIAFAEEFLQSESDETRSNVTFICADFCQYEFGAQQFDTIILSEVLEHLTQPENFLRLAQQLLAPGGTVIVTVPFGINDFPDHKRTYYFTDAFALLSQFYTVIGLGLFDNWIGLTGTNDRDAVALTVDAAIFKKVEENFSRINRLLFDDMKKLRESAADLRQRLRPVQERLDDANKKYRDAQTLISDQKDQLEKARRAYKEAQNIISKTKEALQKSGDALRGSEERRSESERQMVETSHAYGKAQNTISQMEEALQKSDDALRDSEERRSESERQMAETSRKNAIAEKQIVELTAQNAETGAQLGRAMGAVYDANDALNLSRAIIYSLHYDLSKLYNDLSKRTAEKNDLWNLLNRPPVFLFAWSCYKRLRKFARDNRLGRALARCCRALAIDKLLRFFIGKLRK